MYVHVCTQSCRALEECDRKQRVCEGRELNHVAAVTERPSHTKACVTYVAPRLGDTVSPSAADDLQKVIYPYLAFVSQDCTYFNSVRSVSKLAKL